MNLVAAPAVDFADVLAVPNSKRILVASVYFSPDAQHRKIVNFLKQTFGPEHDVPLIVTGDSKVKRKDNTWFKQCVQEDLGMLFVSNI